MLDALLRSFAGISAAEWVAVVLALAYTVLAIRQSPWCWAFAITSSLMFLVPFVRSGLVMQAGLQVFYVAVAVYGWWSWRGGRGEAGEPSVRQWPWRWHAWGLAAVAIVAAVNGRWVAALGTTGIVPYVDALTAWASVLATWLVARKVLETWLYWIVVDLVCAGLYWSQGLHATAVLFVIYTGLAMRGYREWRADWSRSQAGEVSGVVA